MKEIVLKTLSTAGKALRPGDIAKLSGLEKSDVDKAIKELKKEEKIYSPKVCFYEVKK
jgi:DNA-binding MarR family transcriptional regulator